MDRTQLGRVGELALALYVMVTSDGGLDLFTPVSDDDHVDVTVGKRGGIPAIAIQVKSSPAADPDGLVEATASYSSGHVREHPAFLYVVVLMNGVSIATAWVVPSKDFNRLCYTVREHGHDVLEFRAHPDRDDRWAGYRVPALDLGSHLIAVIDALTEKIPPDFLDETAGLMVAVRRSGS